MAEGIFKSMIVAGVVALVALLTMHFARAHDHEHPELNGWYRSLHAEGGAWCCNGDEAIHLADIDWESKDGRYRVRIDKDWIDVPESAEIHDPNRDGRAMVWTYESRDGTAVRCFMPWALG